MGEAGGQAQMDPGDHSVAAARGLGPPASEKSTPACRGSENDLTALEGRRDFRGAGSILTGLHDKRRRKARSDLCTAFSTLNRFAKAIDAWRHLTQVGTTLWIASGADGGNSSLWSNPSDGERARPSAVRSVFSVAFPMKPRAGARPGRRRSQSAALPNISPALRNRCGNLCGYLPFLWNSEAARRSKNKPLREIANTLWPILAPRLMLTCHPFGRLRRAPPKGI